MILYFADRAMNVLGLGTTKKTDGFFVEDDEMVSDIDSGVSTLSFTMRYKNATRERVRDMLAEGNYILRQYDNEQGFFTIIDVEIDHGERTIHVYAEDAGLDLLNEVVDKYEATEAHPIVWYINRFTTDSGFEIGSNEIPDLSRKLKWDGESTASERVRSVATQFDAELGYSFDIDRLFVAHKYINIYKKRGKDVGQQLRLGREINNITEKRSIANLVTALVVTGGTPEGASEPINLIGYSYDDGDIYVNSEGRVLSRSALERWSRYLADGSGGAGLGHIVGTYSYDTTSKSELCNRAVSELKKRMEPEINYDADLAYLPKNLKLGDTINIVDDAGDLYLQARLLQLTEKASENIHTATFGDFLIKSSGISERLIELAAEIKDAAAASTRYTWIAYADDIEGHGISTNPEGKSYIGFAANRLSATVDISDPSIFTWSDMSVSGITLTITSSNGAVFKDSLVTTTLTAHVYMKDAELSAQDIAALGVVNWYSIATGTETYLSQGLTYTVSNSDSTNIIAKLETVEVQNVGNS
jgi:phage minor structural protein